MLCGQLLDGSVPHGENPSGNSAQTLAFILHFSSFSKGSAIICFPRGLFPTVTTLSGGRQGGDIWKALETLGAGWTQCGQEHGVGGPREDRCTGGAS